MNCPRRSISRRRYSAPWITQEPRQEAKLVVCAGLRELEDKLKQKLPNDVTADDVALLFDRHRKTLAESLEALPAKALAPPELRCSVCRRLRGTNPDCDRCQHFEWMRNNPIPREELEGEMAVYHQRQAEEEARDEQRWPSCVAAWWSRDLTIRISSAPPSRLRHPDLLHVIEKWRERELQ